MWYPKMYFSSTKRHNKIQPTHTHAALYVNRIANGNSQIESPQKCYFGTPELTLIFIEKCSMFFLTAHSCWSGRTLRRKNSNFRMYDSHSIIPLRCTNKTHREDAVISSSYPIYQSSTPSLPLCFVAR